VNAASKAAAAPRWGAGTPGPQRSGIAVARWRTAAIVCGLLAYLAFAALATGYTASALVRLAWKQPVSAWGDVSLADIVTAWRATEGHEVGRRRVIVLTLVPAVLFGLVVPFGIVAATQRSRPLHGAARFANRSEIARSGLLSDDGILLGKLGDHVLRLPGQQSVLLSAPTRSGKGVGVVVPNLLAWRGSVVVLDIKGENFDITAGYRARHGQRVFKWAPFAAAQPVSQPGATAQQGTGPSAALPRTHRWNPLGYIRRDPQHVVTDTLAIAQMLYPSGGHASSNETFFAEQAKNLFLGLVLLMFATPERPCTLGELLRQASGQGRSLHEHLRAVLAQREKAGTPLPQACVDALNRFLSTSENTSSSILASLNAPLTLFADPLVDAATSHNDFDLRELRRTPMSVYLVIPANRLAESSVLLNLFFAQAIHQNTDELPQANPALKVPCLLLLDEAAAVGRIAVLSKAIGYLAGYGLRVLTVVQSISQLESVYGRDDARTFATNHAAQILFAPREQRDANEYSEMLGTFTQRERSNGRSVSNGARGSSTSTSVNESSQRRALLLPQEFKELGADKAVIVLENLKPILADKVRYFDDPVFTERLLPPPLPPAIDLARHVARVENRRRLLKPGETVDTDSIAHDFSHLPSLGLAASDDQIEAFVDGVFAVLERDMALLLGDRDSTANSRGAGAAGMDDTDALGDLDALDESAGQEGRASDVDPTRQPGAG
jgi:type IV secretion system protein VirD4